jgi:hypothetical protein
MTTQVSRHRLRSIGLSFVSLSLYDSMCSDDLVTRSNKMRQRNWGCGCHCEADNCVRAIMAQRRPKMRAWQHRDDCSFHKFLQSLIIMCEKIIDEDCIDNISFMLGEARRQGKIIQDTTRPTLLCTLRMHHRCCKVPRHEWCITVTEHQAEAKTGLEDVLYSVEWNTIAVFAAWTQRSRRHDGTTP